MGRRAGQSWSRDRQIFLALSLYSRKHGDQPLLWLLDRMAIPVALAGALIRTGNLFNSEIMGVPTQKPWALVFERVDQMPRHPAQVYEASICLILFVFLVIIYIRRNAQAPPGMLLGLFLSLVLDSAFSWNSLRRIKLLLNECCH